MAARAPRIETREHRRIGRIGVAAILTLTLLLVRTMDAWDAVEGRAFDILSTFAPPKPEQPGAIIVAIDEPSFSALGRQWPWPRDIHATLIERLRAEGAKAIGFDVVFAEPSDLMADAALGKAARRDTVFAADETISENAQASTLIRTEPMAMFLLGGATTGVASVSLDGDGVLRRIPSYPDSFAAAMARASGIEPMTPRDRLIQYFGPSGSYPRISYYQAMEPRTHLPPGMLRGKTVIVGYSLQASPNVGSGASDAFETPYTAASGLLTPGVEVQATMMDNLIHGLSIRRSPGWLGPPLVLLAAFAAFLFARSPLPSRKALLAGGAVLGAVAVSWLLLRYGRIWLSPAGPTAAVALVTGGLAARDYVLERRLRHDVQGAFAQYLSPTIIERLVDDPSLLRLGGEARVMTILFADIRGFTGISEAMKGDPEGLVRMINGILAPLSEVIVAHGGTIDKYMGDCVMAFWNAPLDDPDHAVNAVRAAQAMAAEMEPINAEIRAAIPAERPAPTIRIGIGVNSGPCVVGNFGSEQRFDYSVIGDAVNVASRLEGASKDYPHPIIIGEATAELVGDRLGLIEVDRVTVRGKQEPVTIYTVPDPE